VSKLLTGRLGFYSWQHRVSLFVTMPRLIFLSHPASYPLGTRVFSSGAKRQGHETNNSPSSSAEVRDMCICTSTPLYICMTWCSVEHHGQLYPFPYFLYHSMAIKVTSIMNSNYKFKYFCFGQHWFLLEFSGSFLTLICLWAHSQG
jgi:hypothetical protein